MPGTNNLIQWNPTQANQENDAAYAADTQRLNGAANPSQFASALANKAFYQWSTFVAAFGQMMATKGFNMSDANIATLAATLAHVLTDVDIAAIIATYFPVSIANGGTGASSFQAAGIVAQVAPKIDRTGLTAPISSTPWFTPTVAGLYRVGGWGLLTNGSGLTASGAPTIYFTGKGHAFGASPYSISGNLTTQTGQDQIIYCDASTPVTYTHSWTPGGAGRQLRGSSSRGGFILMKNWLRMVALAALILVPAFGRAQSVTPNIGLEIPAYNQPNWQVPLNYDLNRLDLLLSGNLPLTNLSLTQLTATTVCLGSPPVCMNTWPGGGDGSSYFLYDDTNDNLTTRDTPFALPVGTTNSVVIGDTNYIDQPTAYNYVFGQGNSVYGNTGSCMVIGIGVDEGCYWFASPTQGAFFGYNDGGLQVVPSDNGAPYANTSIVQALNPYGTNLPQAANLVCPGPTGFDGSSLLYFSNQLDWD